MAPSNFSPNERLMRKRLAARLRQRRCRQRKREMATALSKTLNEDVKEKPDKSPLSPSDKNFHEFDNLSSVAGKDGSSKSYPWGRYPPLPLPPRGPPSGPSMSMPPSSGASYANYHYGPPQSHHQSMQPPPYGHSQQQHYPQQHHQHHHHQSHHQYSNPQHHHQYSAHHQYQQQLYGPPPPQYYQQQQVPPQQYAVGGQSYGSYGPPSLPHPQHMHSTPPHHHHSHHHQQHQMVSIAEHQDHSENERPEDHTEQPGVVSRTVSRSPSEGSMASRMRKLPYMMALKNEKVSVRKAKSSTKHQKKGNLMSVEKTAVAAMLSMKSSSDESDNDTIETRESILGHGASVGETQDVKPTHLQLSLASAEGTTEQV